MSLIIEMPPYTNYQQEIINLNSTLSEEVIKHYLKIYKTNFFISRKSMLILKHVYELYKKHEKWFDSLEIELNLPNDNLELIYEIIAKEMFSDGYSWGRIISPFAFSCYISKFLNTKIIIEKLECELNKIVDFLIYLDGWNNFEERFETMPKGLRWF